MRAIEHLGRYCAICRYDGLTCPSAMDFHHPDPFEKDFAISARLTSFEAIRTELAKCVLLCARCHREVHDGMHPGYIEHQDVARGQLPMGDDDFEDEVDLVDGAVGRAAQGADDDAGDGPHEDHGHD